MDFEENVLTLKSLALKLKSFKLIQSLISKSHSTNLVPKTLIYKKHKKPTLNFSPTPQRHILKHNIKISISISWSRILVNFEIVHMTTWWVSTRFGCFINFWHLKRAFGIEMLDIEINSWKWLKVDPSKSKLPLFTKKSQF